ncbi:MAG: DUF4232 domain-containing protein [Jatrophihabitans sp.]|uniref:DUF4232 domain-containing protein n=1 Tax=Jatrophihabitans sp. TaxID=1932789 RepID=UPI003F7FCFB1
MTTLRSRLTVAAASAALAAAGGVTLATNAAAQTVAPACGNQALTVTRSFAQGAAGHSFMELIYRNHTTHACSVHGYPGLDAVGPHGHVLAHAARTTFDGGPRTITIRPGGYASAGVEWENFNPVTSGPCRYSAAIVTTVANTTLAHRLAASVSICGLEVTPTVAGTPLAPGYGPAQHDWIVGARVSSAEQGLWWTRAKHALAATGGYPTQVHELTQLIALPETSLTPAQIAQAHHLVHDLDAFFATPGLYS